VTEEIIRIVVEKLAVALECMFGSSLKKVILYGSCARGDYFPDSDIDVMILLDIPQAELPTVREKVMDITAKLDWDYDVVMTPVVQTIQNFEQYRHASAFYQNIEREGVFVV
jgi:predicted nucleotidyltransferase